MEPFPPADFLARSAAWVVQLDPSGRVVARNDAAQSLVLGEPVPGLSVAPPSRELQLGATWLQVELSPLPDGGQALVAVDITARKQLEERLRRSESMLIDAQGVAHLGTWEWDVSQPNATWSDTLYRIYNVTPEQYSPSYESYLKKVHPDDVEQVKRATERVFHEHLPYSHDERILWPDGTVRHLHTWAYPVLEQGKLVRLVGVCQDITDRKQMEHQLRTVQKHEAIGRLATGIAHDFNNLLTVMVGQSGLIASDEGASATTRRSAEDILTAAMQSSRLTQQLLTLSQGRQGVRARVDLRVVVTDLLDAFEHALGSGVKLVRRLHHAAPFVSGDRSQLDQVVLNLLINARDAMPEGGTLTVELLPANEVPPPRPEGAEDAVVLRVTDSGVGMDDTVLAHLFDPYFTTKPNGTGLGLATVYGVVQQHGGSVHVDSAVGKGSRFNLFFPRSTDSAG